MATTLLLRTGRLAGACCALALAAPIGGARAADAPAAAATTPLPAAVAQAAAPGESATTSSGTTAEQLADRATGLADQVVARWAAVQLPSGRFPDPIYGDTGDYGTAMLGFAMLQRGQARHDAGLMQGGLNALIAQVKQPQGGAFEMLILARAYAWGAAHLPGDAVGAPLWAKDGPVIEADLSRRPPPASEGPGGPCYADARCYNNLKLVSNVGGIDLQATGIKAASAGAQLADIGLRARVLHRLTVRVPKEAGFGVSRTGASPISGAGILSDPPRNPLAYLALSTMMLGSLNDALGDEAPDVSKRAFGRAAQALLALAAPDGDLSWFGRGQGQVWVNGVVADAAAQAASKTSSPQLRGRYLALAEAAIARLTNTYGVGPLGFPLVPGALDATTLASRTVDSYATDRGYNGLAVDSLDQAAAVLKTMDAGASATRMPSARPGVTRSPDQGGLATMTRGGLWFALSSRNAVPGDSRYGSGVLAIQHRDAAGVWSAIAPGRPDHPVNVDTLGIAVGKSVLVPRAQITSAGAATAVRMVGGWARPGISSALVDGGTSWTWSMPDATTIQVQFIATRARTVVANALVGDGGGVTRTPFGMTIGRPDGTTLAYTLGVPTRRLKFHRVRRHIGGSAYDSQPQLAQISAPVRKGERVTLKIRVMSTAPAASGG